MRTFLAGIVVFMVVTRAADAVANALAITTANITTYTNLKATYTPKKVSASMPKNYYIPNIEKDVVAPRLRAATPQYTSETKSLRTSLITNTVKTHILKPCPKSPP